MFWMTFFEVGTQCLNRLFLKKTKAKRLTLNCIFFTQYLVLSWRFLHNQPAACLSKDNYGWETILLWWSVFQQTTATTDCISKSTVWGNDGEADYEPLRWSAELPLLCNIYDYPDALLEMNDLFKRRLQQNVLFVSSEKGPTYEQDLTYRDNLVDYTLSDDVTISHFFIQIIISCVQWYTLWGE